MTLDIDKALRNTFHEAVMQHAAQFLKKGSDWEQVDIIMNRGKDQRDILNDKYRNEYGTRVEIVRKRLVKEAGEFNFNHPNPGSRDKFDSEAINRQAQREVQHDHERVVQQSHDTQTNDILSLTETARQRDLPRGKAREQFTQASDRRKEPDRRSPAQAQLRKRS